jgi:hypothetical protein
MEMHSELKELFLDTQPVCNWQAPLKQLLQLYLLPNDEYAAIDFLINMV